MPLLLAPFPTTDPAFKTIQALQNKRNLDLKERELALAEDAADGPFGSLGKILGPALQIGALALGPAGAATLSAGTAAGLFAGGQAASGGGINLGGFANLLGATAKGKVNQVTSEDWWKTGSEISTPAAPTLYNEKAMDFQSTVG